MRTLRWKRSKTYVHLLSTTPDIPSTCHRASQLTRYLRTQDGTTTSKTFVHTPSVIQAEEAEEIGVEHLLRDIRDVAVGTLSARITSQLQSLQGLHLRLRDIGTYLGKVANGELPVNHAILGNLQDVFNLLPGLSAPALAAAGTKGADGARYMDGHGVQEGPLALETPANELARAMSVKTNDQLMSIYLSSLIRAITAFHDLIENKIQNKQRNEEAEEKESAKAVAEDKKDEKDGVKEKGKESEGDKKDPEGKDAKPKSAADGKGYGGKGEGWRH